MTIQSINRVFFIGIGGIGMSALARFFLQRGKHVSGYDKTPTLLTEQLITEGALISFEDDAAYCDTDADLVIYTPAVKQGSIMERYTAQRTPMAKRSEVLGMITESGYSICIAGTHGKTSISTMVAHILRHTGYGCNAFLGGIAANYNTNYWGSERDVFVVEADEFDRSFLRLHPDIAIVSAVDPDHLDIYGTAGVFEAAFKQFVGLLDADGLLLFHANAAIAASHAPAKSICYAMRQEDGADVFVRNLQVQGRGFQFDIDGMLHMQSISMSVGGLHNVENMLAAIIVANHLGIDHEKIKEAVAEYAGVHRRFAYVVGGFPDSAFTYIDDYAHHPTELNALLTSVRNRFPEKRITILFQPHLFSRTRDFAQGFADALSLADEVWLLPIYPARELPVPGIDSEMLASLIHNRHVQLVQREALATELSVRRPQVLVSAGAGDIDQLVPVIKTWWENNQN